VPAAAPVAEKPVMFHYSNDDSTIRGPFSIEAMRAMIRDGVIRVDTPVARVPMNGKPIPFIRNLYK